METYRERRLREQEEAQAVEDKRRRSAKASELRELQEKAEGVEALLAESLSPEKVKHNSSLQQKKRELEATLDRWYERIETLRENT